jgi:hypothetical protein
MNCPREVRVLLVCVSTLLVPLAGASLAWAQFKDAPFPRVGPAPIRAQPQAGETPAEPDTPEEPAGVVDTNTRPVTPIGPREIRFNLMDGNVIAGALSIDEITVETDFGPLKVPISRIRAFNPGLDSNPAVSGRLEKLIEDLGGDDYASREEAHKQLVQWGLPIRALLQQWSDDGNAERKRHLTGILAELEEQAGADDEEEPVRPLIRRDTIETTEFTIVGRIVEQEFKVASKYGELTVKLADINTGDRSYGGGEPINKKLDVEGTYVAQQQFKSSGIRVKAGDRVTVRADGQLVMTPWGGNYTSTPEGGANYGWYMPNEIPGGALVAKIGNGGKAFKVGSRHTFTARSAGLLMFAVGMDNNYAGEGYNYPGKYEVRIKVEPQ